MKEHKLQPPMPIGGSQGDKKLVANTQRSRARLEQLKFDPIEKLVRLYDILEAENVYWIQLRQASSVQELDANGKKKKTHRYSGVAHAAVLSQMGKVAADLMRYAYGRVPETINVNTEKPKPMIINLSDDRSVMVNAEVLENIPDAEIVYD
jgi:hypothetical protein